MKVGVIDTGIAAHPDLVIDGGEILLWVKTLRISVTMDTDTGHT